VNHTHSKPSDFPQNYDYPCEGFVVQLTLFDTDTNTVFISLASQHPANFKLRYELPKTLRSATYFAEDKIVPRKAAAKIAENATLFFFLQGFCNLSLAR